MEHERLRALLGELRLSAKEEERVAGDLVRLLASAPSAARAKLPVLLSRLLADVNSATLSERGAVTHSLAGPLAVSDTWVASAARMQETVIPHLDHTPERAPDDAIDGARYEDLGFLGEGGMGEVRRVLDRALGRTVALKRVREAIRDAPELATRFTEEAQICAQLQHPGIIPVYDFGRLPDGRLYFTMQEIEGEDLGAQLRRYHADAQPSATGDTPGLRRLLDVFQRVCEAVAYAHARGVIHRDLKPDNVMIGSEGQVRVLDWGIAKTLGSSPLVVDAIAGAARTAAPAAGVGELAGTPTYMAPEQLLGRHDAIDARTDVYALGLILYEILVGSPPGGAERPWSDLLERTRAELPSPVDAAGERALPAELVDICRRALRRAPDERYPHAGALARAVSSWQEGVRQREQARRLVAEAAELDARVATLREDATSLRAQASSSLQRLPPWASETIRHPHWRQLDAARGLELEAAHCHFESEQRLHAALSLAPGLDEAHAALAVRHAREHAAAEACGRDDDAARAELYVRTHTASLPQGSPVRARLTAYLKAEGTLALATDPPTATIHIHPFELQDRRLHEGPPRGDPITAQALRRQLPIGSYLLRISAPGHATVRYPVVITRGEVWDATPPGATEPAPIWLPPASAVAADEVFVAAGWFRAGGDPAALNGLPACRLWLDGFLIRREPVTNREYVAFINDQLAAGAEAAAARALPIDPTANPPTPLYRRDADGRYHCTDIAPPEFPVVHIDWPSARAFCRWLAARDGRPWRLPDELEWEKAARGVDGRLFPWGSWLDASRCGNRDSHPEPRMTTTDAYPVDMSPYGVLGMAGNSMDWCANPFVAPETFDISPRRVTPLEPGDDEDEATTVRLYRGGSWSYNAQLCRLARRFRHDPRTRVNDLGVRPVCSLG